MNDPLFKFNLSSLLKGSESSSNEGSPKFFPLTTAHLNGVLPAIKLIKNEVNYKIIDFHNFSEASQFSF
jgi:hypothetical protein